MQQIFSRKPPWLWSCVLICWFADIAWAVSTLKAHSHAVPRHVPPAMNHQQEADLHNLTGHQHETGDAAVQRRRNTSAGSAERASPNISRTFAGSSMHAAAAPALHSAHHEAEAEARDGNAVDSDIREVLSHSQRKRRHHAGDAGEPRTWEAAARQDRHLLLVYPGNTSANRSAPVKDIVEDDLDPDQKRARFFGLPKIFWALIADVVAIFIFVLGIPATLYISKRRKGTAS